MTPIERFEREREERIAGYRDDAALQAGARAFLHDSLRAKYSYNFSWLGRPIIQYPQDIVALQEIVWRVRPELVVETGIAHGGSLALFASLLELLGGDGIVVGIDNDIRQHNRPLIEGHPLHRRMRLLEGSSLDERIIAQTRAIAAGRRTVLLCLDSSHTHAHVLGELRAYAPLVSLGSYAVVFDGIIEQMPPEFSADRDWGPGDNPLTAVRQFLAEDDRFVVDEELEGKLLITAAPSGYLRRVK